jgi:hypothetical protein
MSDGAPQAMDHSAPLPLAPLQRRFAVAGRPLSRRSDPASYPTEPLASFRTYRQLSRWNPPPLMVRAVRAHCQLRTHALQQAQREGDIASGNEGFARVRQAPGLVTHEVWLF